MLEGRRRFLCTMRRGEGKSSSKKAEDQLERPDICCQKEVQDDGVRRRMNWQEGE